MLVFESIEACIFIYTCAKLSIRHSSRSISSTTLRLYCSSATGAEAGGCRPRRPDLDLERQQPQSQTIELQDQAVDN
jgi:hypothetical protein